MKRCVRSILFLTVAFLVGPEAWSEAVRGAPVGLGGGDRADVRAAVVAALRRASSDVEDLRAASSALAELTPAPVPELFELLWEPRVPDGWLPEGEDALVLGPVRHALLVDAFRALSIDTTMEWLRALERGESDPRARLKALRLLGSLARPSELRLMVRLSVQADGATTSGFVLAFGRALVALIERHPATLGALAPVFVELPDALLGPTVAALEAARVPGRVETITRLLGRVRRVDPLLLSALVRVARSESPPYSDQAASSVRLLLSRSDPETALLAVRAAGALRDPRAVPDLIGLMSEQGANVREAAHDALREIVDLDVGPRAASWERWYRKETGWWQRESQAVIDGLLHGTAVEAVDAIRDLAVHRLYRSELALRILGGLNREEPGVVALVAGLLGDLGSPVAVDPLRRVLRRGAGSPAAEQAVLRALSRLVPGSSPPRTP